MKKKKIMVTTWSPLGRGYGVYKYKRKDWRDWTIYETIQSVGQHSVIGGCSEKWEGVVVCVQDQNDQRMRASWTLPAGLGRGLWRDTIKALINFRPRKHFPSNEPSSFYLGNHPSSSCSYPNSRNSMQYCVVPSCQESAQKARDRQSSTPIWNGAWERWHRENRKARYWLTNYLGSTEISSSKPLCLRFPLWCYGLDVLHQVEAVWSLL